MFDFAWSELALIAIVALVVIGPKDLPRAMRTLGFWVRRARRVAGEFQNSVEQMMREAELDEVRQQVEKAARFNVGDEIARHMDPDGSIRASLDDPVLKNPLDHAPETQTVPSLGAPQSPPAEPAAPEDVWRPAAAPDPAPEPERQAPPQASEPAPAAGEPSR